MGTQKGIDVSTWQGGYTDFSKVKKAGNSFVIIRAGYGKEKSQIDNQFINNYNKARKAGLKLGAYWYSYAKSEEEAIQEAEACLSVIGGKKFEMPIFYDVEETRTLKLGSATVRKIISAFCNKLKQNKYYCGITSFLSAFEDIIGIDFANKYPVWVAQYYNKCTYKGNFAIWQHKNSAKVDGITTGVVDEDFYYPDKMNYENYIKANGYNGFSAQFGSLFSPNEIYIAFEVINGRWSSGEKRKQMLEQNKYNYNRIQEIVNILLNNKINMFEKSKIILTTRR